MNPVSLGMTVEHFSEFVNGVDQAIAGHGSQFLEGSHYAVEVCLDGRSSADIELLGPTDLLDGSEKKLDLPVSEPDLLEALGVVEMAGRVLGIGMVEQVVSRVAVCIDGPKHGYHVEALQVGQQAAGGYVRLSDLLVFRRLSADQPVLLKAHHHAYLQAAQELEVVQAAEPGVGCHPGRS